MSYIATLEGFEGQKIEVQVSFWTGPKLLVNGMPAPKGAKAGEMLLQRNDGRQVAAAWKMQLFGLDVPQLVVDGKTIQFVGPLKWYQWIWGGWPIALLFLGGALGAVAGMLAFWANTKIFRSEMTPALKYLVTGVVSVGMVGLYLVMATILSVLLHR
jgi:hypothetical protein